MERICMFVHINGLNSGRLTLVSELGLIGNGVWEEPICMDYDTSCYCIEAEKRKMYGLPVSSETSFRNSLQYLDDVKTFYEFENSRSRPLVGIFADKDLAEILKSNSIPYVDLLDFGMTEGALDLEESYVCRSHLNSIMGCAGQRVTSYRDFVLRNCDGSEMARSKRQLFRLEE